MENDRPLFSGCNSNRRSGRGRSQQCPTTTTTATHIGKLQRLDQRLQALQLGSDTRRELQPLGRLLVGPELASLWRGVTGWGRQRRGNTMRQSMSDHKNDQAFIGLPRTHIDTHRHTTPHRTSTHTDTQGHMATRTHGHSHTHTHRYPGYRTSAMQCCSRVQFCRAASTMRSAMCCDNTHPGPNQPTNQPSPVQAGRQRHAAG